MKSPYLTVLIFVAGLSASSLAQKNILTAGFVFRPMLVNSYISGGSDDQIDDQVKYSAKQRWGYSFGMVVCKGITKALAFESGINYVQRNYTINIDSLENDYSNDLNFRAISFGIPFKLLVLLRASEYSYFSGGLGVNLDLYPSDVGTDSDQWQTETVRKSWIQGSMLADVGWEYRTMSSGFFYVGLSLQLPFVPPFLSKIGLVNSIYTETSMDLGGTFLALSLRYYFPMRKDKLEN